MKVILLILPLLMSFVHFKNNCEKLKNGTYFAKHTSNNGAIDYRLTINGKQYKIQKNDRLTEKGRVNWIGDCSLRLEPEITTKQDTTELAKKMYQSFGLPFLEIKDAKGDTTYFRTTWTGNLHITINEGYLLRIN